MNLFQYIIRSLRYYRKQHLILLLATVLSTAVLTGSLVVGDSVRDSLQNLVDARLGAITHALSTSDRLVENSLAKRLSVALNTPVSALLSTTGAAANPESSEQINRVNIYGIDSVFCTFSKHSIPLLLDNEAVISENVAIRLGLNKGDFFSVRAHLLDEIPVNAPFSEGKDPLVAIRLQVKQIATDSELARFSLHTDQKAPFNIFVASQLLEAKLELKNKANLLLLADNESNLQNLSAAFDSVFDYSDAGLKISIAEKYTEITSSRVFIDHVLTDTICSVFPTEKIVTYLVNDISNKERSTPWSFVSATSNDTLLSKGELVLNSWCADDLSIKAGDSISLDYFVINSFRKLEVNSKRFLVKAVETNQGERFTSSLMPEFPGLSDAEHCGEWESSLPIDFSTIRDKDEQYWNLYKGTPKAMISPEDASEMWGTPFGNYTALRIDNKFFDSRLPENRISEIIKPKKLGLQWREVKQYGVFAAENGVNFGELFLSLSFFVIVSAIILLALVSSLHAYSRKKELEVFRVLGFPFSRIKKMFLTELFVPVFVGSIIGLIAGLGFNKLLIFGLNTLWNDAVRTHAIEASIHTGTLITSFIIGFTIAYATVWVTLKKIFKSLEKEKQYPVKACNEKERFVLLTAIAFLIFGVALLGYYLLLGSKSSPSFALISGAMLLVSFLLLVRYLLNVQNNREAFTAINFSKLVAKNVQRNQYRSLATVILLSLATFSVIITGANRKTFFASEKERSSGTGGFQIWVDNSIPVTENLNSKTGKAKYSFDDNSLADSIQFFQFRVNSGSDASCLNLNKVVHPVLIGVESSDFDSLGAFSFAKLLPGVSPDHPWQELEKEYSNGVIPCYLDQTVITWGLLMQVGDTLHYSDELGNSLDLVIAGGLNSSVFQGKALIDAKLFNKYFPSNAGSQCMLISSPDNTAERVIQLIHDSFSDLGTEAVKTSELLARFNSVTNTYLDIFMLLGALALVIGTLGLGIMIMRNRYERVTEFALLLAIGWIPERINRLLVVENLVLLFVGVGIGLIASLVGMMPSWLSLSMGVPMITILAILAVVLLNGFIWIFIASCKIAPAKIISNLRWE